MSEENKCPLCGQDNPDILESHLATLSGDYDYYASPVILHLWVNCHRAIHRCCWALISEDSEAILDKYFSFLESLLPFFPCSRRSARSFWRPRKAWCGNMKGRVMTLAREALSGNAPCAAVLILM